MFTSLTNPECEDGFSEGSNDLVRGQLAEIVGELIRAADREFTKTANTRASPESSLFSAPETPALVVTFHEPCALRNAQSVNRRRILLTGLYSFLDSHFGDQRTVDPV